MKYIFTTLLLIMITSVSFSQVGTITGTVSDQKAKEGLIAASVTLYKAGTERPITGASTDFDGKFQIDYIPAGIYDIEYSYVEYTTYKMYKVEIKEGYQLVFNIKLAESKGIKCLSIVGDYEHKLINQDEPFTGRVYSADDIKNLPIKW